MNWIKVIHLKNEEVIAINITNMSFNEIIEGINKELESNYSIEVENESTIYVINIEEVTYIEVRCINNEQK